MNVSDVPSNLSNVTISSGMTVTLTDGELGDNFTVLSGGG